MRRYKNGRLMHVLSKALYAIAVLVGSDGRVSHTTFIDYAVSPVSRSEGIPDYHRGFIVYDSYGNEDRVIGNGSWLFTKLLDEVIN